MNARRTLIVETLEGDPLAKITLGDGPVLEWADEEVRAEVEDVLEQLSSKSLVVREVRGAEAKDHADGRHQVGRTVTPDDEGYLLALADRLMRERVRIGGILVRGVVREG